MFLEARYVLQAVGCLYIVVIHKLDLCEHGLLIRQGTQTTHSMADLAFNFETWIAPRLLYLMTSKASHTESGLYFLVCCRKFLDSHVSPRYNVALVGYEVDPVGLCHCSSN